MRNGLLWFPLVLLVLWTSPLGAQQPDLSSLLQRLDRLEKQNERLEQQNQALESRFLQLQKSNGPGLDSGENSSPTVADLARRAAKFLIEEADGKKLEEVRQKDAGFQVGTALKMEGTWHHGLWFESPDKAFKWNVGGVIQFDMNWHGANQPIVNSVGVFNNLVDPGLSLQDGMAFRRARLRFAGTMWEQLDFFAQYEFAQALDLRRQTLGISPVPTTPPNSDFDPGDNVGFNEVYLGIDKIPLVGKIRIGRQRESLNFVTATADNNQVWLERGLLFDAFNGDFNFSNGVTVQNAYFDQRMYALAGFFQINNNSTNRGFYAVGDGEYAYDGRLTGLPLWNEDNQLWVHLGADYSYRNLHQNQVRYRARPMVRSGPSFLTPNILNTGAIFSPDGQQLVNLEFAAAYKRFTVAAEAARGWVTNASTGGLPPATGKLPSGVTARGTYIAKAAYAEALYFLTPDHRTYRKERPGYDRVIPSRNFFFLNGEDSNPLSPGAWEIGVRYDYLDLTDAGINGGMSNAVTFCLNWYLNPNARIQANYSVMNRIFSPSDTSGRVNGDVQGFGLRFNVDF